MVHRFKYSQILEHLLSAETVSIWYQNSPEFHTGLREIQFLL